ncbi:MAG: carbon starvation protein A, partial [Ignavibacteriaceae bacterium]|nr:carbon starvation protein A [Ignavibacteriaceae bacterium]
DTATRLARFMFQEYFESKEKSGKSALLTNRFVATAITIAFGAALTFSGKTMSMWPLFGSANQLLAALALLALTVWVANMKKGFLFVLIPMLFMFAVTLTALGMLIYQNFIIDNYTLSIISVLLFTLAILLGIKAYNVLLNGRELNKETT